MGQFITYAQNNEDAILAAYFKDVPKGVYVDIGANHPVNDSVTKHFYDKGWRGINVEPIKSLYELLEKERPEDTNVRVGISDKQGELTLREYVNDGLSTFLSSLQKAYAKDPNEKTAKYKDVQVPVITLAQLFEQYAVKRIHFMKVDVEGFEYNVLIGNDWKKYRPEMLCIEANHDVHDRDWRSILEQNNYEKVWNDGLNDYYLAGEAKKRKNNFSYVEDMLLGEQILPHHVLDRIDELQRQIHEEQVKLEVQAIRFKQLEHDRYTAEAVIQEQQRFKNSLKLLIRAVDNVISARIERLRAKKAWTGVHFNSDATVEYDVSSKERLLASIRASDMKAYYSVRKRRQKQKFYTYRVANELYKFTRKAATKSLRLLERIARRGKRV